MASGATGPCGGRGESGCSWSSASRGASRGLHGLERAARLQEPVALAWALSTRKEGGWRGWRGRRREQRGPSSKRCCCSGCVEPTVRWALQLLGRQPGLGAPLVPNRRECSCLRWHCGHGAATLRLRGAEGEAAEAKSSRSVAPAYRAGPRPCPPPHAADAGATARSVGKPFGVGLGARYWPRLQLQLELSQDREAHQQLAASADAQHPLSLQAAVNKPIQPPQRERGLTKEKSARRRNHRECVMEKGKGKTSRPSQATARPGEAHSSLSLRSPKSPTDPAGGPTPVQGVAAPGGAERQNVAWVFS